MIELFIDPTIWLGLLSLILLEIVLGIDNLVFIAILVDRLEPSQRDKARKIGLALALIMRLMLLAAMSWLVTLTAPIFYLQEHAFSFRDLILIGGGLFLLFKGTMEIHERLDARKALHQGPRVHAGFSVVIMQIVTLDAIFSLDSVITAVGMVDQLWVMMLAVTIAIFVMLLASKPLTEFVNERPTVVILCLGFLMMIGFALVAEGFGLEIPKAYLYAAIGFSVLVETLNQWARHNQKKQIAKRPLRERTADAVLSLLGEKPNGDVMVDSDVSDSVAVSADDLMSNAFQPAERQMIRSVLRLADAPIQTHMTPRPDVAWVDIDADTVELLSFLQKVPYSRFLICQDDELDKWLGVVESRNLLVDIMQGKTLDLAALASQPLVVMEGTSSLNVLEALRQHPVPLAVVVDEYGSVQGVVSTADLLAAIAGELFDTVDAGHVSVDQRADGSWLLDGGLPLDQLSDLLDRSFVSKEYYTLAGLVLAHLQSLPEPGQQFELEGYRFVVAETEGQRILKVEVYPLGEMPLA